LPARRDICQGRMMVQPTDSTDSPRAAYSWVDRIADGLSALGSVWIVALMLLIVADVVGRSFLNHPITGVAEVAARSVAAIVFLQIAAAILQGRLTRADFLMRLITARSSRTRDALELIFALVAAVVFAAIVYAAWPRTVSAWATSEFFGVQGVFTIPIWPFRAILVGGAGLATLAALVVAWRHFRLIGFRR
jgi:TRAP-type mannitol/chloroaromatic compound transport system permease small subunit